MNIKAKKAITYAIVAVIVLTVFTHFWFGKDHKRTIYAGVSALFLVLCDYALDVMMGNVCQCTTSFEK